MEHQNKILWLSYVSNSLRTFSYEMATQTLVIFFHSRKYSNSCGTTAATIIILWLSNLHYCPCKVQSDWEQIRYLYHYRHYTIIIILYTLIIINRCCAIIMIFHHPFSTFSVCNKRIELLQIIRIEFPHE